MGENETGTKKESLPAHPIFNISNVISQYLYQRLMYLVTQITLF
jgi:hypothetical protein